MVVLSVQDVERFTPDKYLVDGQAPADAPVYLIGGMTWRERAKWRAQIAGEGVRFPGDAEMIKAVRQAIAELAPSNAAELLAVVQAYDDLPTRPALAPTDGETDEEAAARAEEAEARKAVVQPYEALIDKLRTHPVVGSLIGMRMLHNEIVPPMTAAFCLRGWENVRAKFERVNGVVPDAILNELPEDDLALIGNKALAMQQVSAAQKGN